MRRGRKQWPEMLNALKWKYESNQDRQRLWRAATEHDWQVRQAVCKSHKVLLQSWGRKISSHRSEKESDWQSKYPLKRAHLLLEYLVLLFPNEEQLTVFYSYFKTYSRTETSRFQFEPKERKTVTALNLHCWTPLTPFRPCLLSTQELIHCPGRGSNIHKGKSHTIKSNSNSIRYIILSPKLDFHSPI